MTTLADGAPSVPATLETIKKSSNSEVASFCNFGKFQAITFSLPTFFNQSSLPSTGSCGTRVSGRQISSFLLHLPLRAGERNTSKLRSQLRKRLVWRGRHDAAATPQFAATLCKDARL